MANGTNYGYMASGLAPASYMGPEWEGKLRVTHDSYTFASAAAATTVNVGVLRPGEVFMGGFVVNAALGSGVTLQLGDSGDDDRYMDAAAASSAGNINARKAEGIGYKNTGTTDIAIVLKTAGAEASGAVEVVINKACPN